MAPCNCIALSSALRLSPVSSGYHNITLNICKKAYILVMVYNRGN